MGAQGRPDGARQALTLLPATAGRTALPAGGALARAWYDAARVDG